MQIALVRHGKPRFESSPIRAQHLVSWVDSYNRGGIDPAVPPPAKVRELAVTAAYTLSSDLPRAIESLRALDPERTAPAEHILREAELPGLPSIPIPLDPHVWAAVARVFWFLGWSRATESRSAARQRARQACQRLVALAATHGSVLIVGHGVFNAFIAKELRARGWRGPMWPGGGYWTAAVYRKSDT